MNKTRECSLYGVVWFPRSGDAAKHSSLQTFIKYLQGPGCRSYERQAKHKVYRREESQVNLHWVSEKRLAKGDTDLREEVRLYSKITEENGVTVKYCDRAKFAKTDISPAKQPLSTDLLVTGNGFQYFREYDVHAECHEYQLNEFADLARELGESKHEPLKATLSLFKVSLP